MQTLQSHPQALLGFDLGGLVAVAVSMWPLMCSVPACFLNRAATALPEGNTPFPRGRLEGLGSVAALSGDESGRLVETGRAVDVEAGNDGEGGTSMSGISSMPCSRSAVDVEADNGGEGGTSMSGISSILSAIALSVSRWMMSSEIEPQVFSSRARRSAA